MFSNNKSLNNTNNTNNTNNSFMSFASTMHSLAPPANGNDDGNDPNADYSMDQDEIDDMSRLEATKPTN